MIVALTGASGFVGQRLTRRLTGSGHTVRALSRSSREFPWDALTGPAPAAAFDGADAVVHLLGEPVAQRWNAEVKRRVRESRVLGTRNMVAGIAAATARPRVLVSASAIGYYGDTGENAAVESDPPGSDYLAQTCAQWEREAAAAKDLGLTVARIRIGIVLGQEGGALKEMLAPFRMGAGGPIASGKQWISWIHAADLVSMIVSLLENPVNGAINATSPNPVRQIDFARELGRVLGRPSVMPVPKFALKMMFGEAADHMTASLRVLPKAATEAGFPYRFPELRAALEDLLGAHAASRPA